MPAFAIQVHRDGNSGFFQGIIIEEGTIDIRFIVFGLNDHCGRGFGSYFDFGC